MGSRMKYELGVSSLFTEFEFGKKSQVTGSYPDAAMRERKSHKGGDGV